MEGDTTGLNPSLNKKIVVVFHVLIPASTWGWDDKCRVHLRFGHINLGKWKEDIGTFNFVR